MKSKRIVAFVVSVLLLVTIVPFGAPEAVSANATVSTQSSVKSSHTPLEPGKYYQYSQLNANQKQAYNTIAKGIEAYKNKIDIKKYNIQKDEAFVLIQEVLADHPEYFYVSKEHSLTLDETETKAREVILYYCDGKKTDGLTENYTPIIRASRATIKKQAQAVEKKAKEIVSKIPKKATQLEKEKYIHDYLTKNIRYNVEAVTNEAAVSKHIRNIYGALIEKSAVCEGYANAFVYLCHKVGINATLVTGYSNGLHMWNAVEIDKTWYLVDVTWDDNDDSDITLYQYFNVTTPEMAIDHITQTQMAYPTCTSSQSAYKKFCINMENNTLPSNYKMVADTVIKNKEQFLPLYIGKDDTIDMNIVRKFFINSDSPLQKHIKSKGYNVDVGSSYLQYGHYLFLIVHIYSNPCDATCNRCADKRAVEPHSYKKVTTTKATLTKNGTARNTCTKCGYKASKAIAISRPTSFQLSTTAYTYDGKTKSPVVTVKDAAGKTLKKNTDYTVSYASGRKNVGAYKVTIKMKGNYSGTKTLTFKINPPNTTVNKMTSATKSLKVTIGKKTAQVTGYQVQYSTSKSFKSYTTKWLTKNSTTSATLSKLKAKTTYYVRVRTYKKVGSTTYYSGWSTVKSAKTK